MLKLPYLLAEIDDKVLETNEKRRDWNHGGGRRGTQVTHGRDLAEITVSAYIVLPDLSPEDIEHQGVFSLLTLGRGDAADFSDEIFVHITYDASRSLLEVRKNVGGKNSKLVGVALEGATPELVCGRVLELYVEINRDRICVWLHDRFAGGDFLLQAIGPWTTAPAARESSDGPWGVPPSGRWWVKSGLGSGANHQQPALSPGFGLSNLRVVLAAASDEAVGSLLYRGALDHLVAEPPQGVAEAEICKLAMHGKQLQDIGTDLERLRLLLPISKPPAAAAILEAAANAAFKAAKKALRRKPHAKSPGSALAQQNSDQQI